MTTQSKPIERTNALTLMRDSQEYFEYYKRGCLNKSIDISKVSYFLLMRSIELGLKALLKIKEGIGTSKLKSREFGHDIERLYSYCVKKKHLEPFNEELQSALRISNNYYFDKDFEYTRIGYKTLPSTAYLVQIIKNIHNKFQDISKDINSKRFI